MSLEIRSAADDAIRAHGGHSNFQLVEGYKHTICASVNDEVVHGKGSLLGKMAGDAWQKRANLRALYAWTWAMPGAPLLFMGAELAQPTHMLFNLCGPHHSGLSPHLDAVRRHAVAVHHVAMTLIAPDRVRRCRPAAAHRPAA